eukprot:1637027-Prymnesium_polylepis.1
MGAACSWSAHHEGTGHAETFDSGACGDGIRAPHGVIIARGVPVTGLITESASAAAVDAIRPLLPTLKNGSASYNEAAAERLYE